MLMSRMRRGNVVLLLLLALSVAGQPYVHQHPLIPETHGNGAASPVSLPCAICVTSTARVLVEVPRTIAPAATSQELVPSRTVIRLAAVASALPARAPPAA